MGASQTSISHSVFSDAVNSEHDHITQRPEGCLGCLRYRDHVRMLVSMSLHKLQHEQTEYQLLGRISQKRFFTPRQRVQCWRLLNFRPATTPQNLSLRHHPWIDTVRLAVSKRFASPVARGKTIGKANCSIEGIKGIGRHRLLRSRSHGSPDCGQQFRKRDRYPSNRHKSDLTREFTLHQRFLSLNKNVGTRPDAGVFEAVIGQS